MMLSLASNKDIRIVKQDSLINKIYFQEEKLLKYFEKSILIQPSLNRKIVSFQANKMRPFYRWYKFKEAFSYSLVEYVFRKYQIDEGTILDPFAGCGTALFAASDLGIDADGIELLPVGNELININLMIREKLTTADLNEIKMFISEKNWTTIDDKINIIELRITTSAYPEKTKESLEKYLAAIHTKNERIKSVLFFALLCVLESISYTRKDGQHLRWDHRSGRRTGKSIFDKGTILDFDQAISMKIEEIISDSKTKDNTNLFQENHKKGEIRLYKGSCLNILPSLPANSYNAIITSPPYCNRYDYTRTYALELALLGIDQEKMTKLRQEMLCCTVENREKDLLKINPGWKNALEIADNQRLLQNIVEYLELKKSEGELNNNGIPRMVKGYFYELASIISECQRVLKPGALMFMVNDNVRYAGVGIPVDLILSDIAEQLGFKIENIFVLPNGKGNSSQQMRKYGHEKQRKCVYVWRKK